MGDACRPQRFPGDHTVRILHVINSLDPATGGPPRVVCRMAAAQALLGHQVTVSGYEVAGSAAALSQMVEPLPGFGQVRVELLGERGAWDRLFSRRAAGLLRPLAERAEVVHLHGVWDSIMLAAGRVARAVGRPYFTQPNGMLNAIRLRRRRLKKQAAWRLGFRGLFAGSAGMLLGNEDERAAVAALNLGVPLHVVPLNSVFLEEIDPLPAAGRFRARYPVLGDRPFIVFLGRLHQVKGLDYLAEAFALLSPRLPEVRLVLVGHDEGARADFARRIARAGLAERVLLTGPLHGQAKWEAYRDAACFVLPSREEGFSIAITEALAAGLPVVISRTCHFGEVAEVGAGVVTELDAASIAEGLYRVLADDAGRQRMAAAARRLIVERFSAREMARATVAAYGTALG